VTDYWSNTGSDCRRCFENTCYVAFVNFMLMLKVGAAAGGRRIRELNGEKELPIRKQCTLGMS
jgi:hypothetical protein